MSKKSVKLAIAGTAPKDLGRYRDAVRRLREVSLASHLEEADAVITNEIDVAAAAAGKGRHVLFVHPTLVPVRHLAQAAEASQRNGARFVPAHVWRFGASVRAVRSALEDGALGEPGLLRIHRWEPRVEVGSSGDLASRTAPLVEELDLANWLFGGRPATVYAVARRSLVQAHLGFVGGGMALVDFAWGLPPGGDYASRSLIGSTGAAYADDHHNMNLLYAGGEPSAIRTSEGHLDVIEQLGEFVDGLRGGERSPVTVDATRDALDVHRAVVAAAESHRVATLNGAGYELE